MKMNSSTGFQNVDPTRAVSIELVDKMVNQNVCKKPTFIMFFQDYPILT